MSVGERSEERLHRHKYLKSRITRGLESPSPTDSEYTDLESGKIRLDGRVKLDYSPTERVDIHQKEL